MRQGTECGSQLVRCKEKQQELHRQLVTGMPEDSCPEFLIAMWNEFQANHKERKIKQSLDLVKRLDSGLQDAHAAFHQRIESFGELKSNIRATLNPDDPLNLADYEPPHEEAIAKLRAIARGVLKSQQAWESDLRSLERAFDSDNALADLKRHETESAELAESTRVDLDAAQEEVNRCWEALLAAQSKCTRAEARHAAAKVQVRSPPPPPPAHLTLSQAQLLSSGVRKSTACRPRRALGCRARQADCDGDRVGVAHCRRRRASGWWKKWRGRWTRRSGCWSRA
jgi:hypothetical protein